MNTAILARYGISLQKQDNGNIGIQAHSRNLDSYLYLFTRKKDTLREFIASINTVLHGNYASLPYDHREWSLEMGLQIITGIMTCFWTTTTP